MHVRNSDAEIFYRVLGKGPDLVLIHPFPVHHQFWLPVAEKLAAEYRIILPDVRGLGDSTAGDGAATMEKHASDLAAVCNHAAVKSAISCGVSIGGYILFEFWRRQRQRVNALLLCNTRAQADSAEGRANRLKSVEDIKKKGTEPFFESMVPKLLGETTRRNRPDIVEAVHGMMRKSTPEGIIALQLGMAERPDSIPTLKTIAVPTLIVAAEEDTLTPASDSELMRQHIRNSELKVIPKGGHFAMFERHDLGIEMLRSFLSTLPR
jgi:3-oxoadipate enol-lactonase